MRIATFLLVVVGLGCSAAAQSPPASSPMTTEALSSRFPPPPGFVPVVVDDDSFGAWLRQRRLAPIDTPVRRFDGAVVQASWAKHVVVGIDVGTKDLQQCADSAIRLYAEYRRARGTLATTTFHATSGDPMPYARYAAGERARAEGRGLVWRRGADSVTSTSSAVVADRVFSTWLDDVFMYAGSLSIARDTVPAGPRLRPGDLLVIGGSPGHVLVVMDVAERDDGEQRLLLGQGYMPAQSFHVLGWYAADGDGVRVPSWPATFPSTGWRRFAQ
ncbi:MAG TPA: DUF4846 domain-containing protein [Myxococcota bacterium]